MDIIKTQNHALGSFEPFKTNNITPEQMKARLKLSTDLIQQSKQLGNLRQQQADIQNNLTAMNYVPATLSPADQGTIKASRASMVAYWTKQQSDLNTKVDALMAKVMTDVKAASEQGLRVYGADAALEVQGDTQPSERNTNINQERMRNDVLQVQSRHQSVHSIRRLR
jgi:hypothetical protein